MFIARHITRFLVIIAIISLSSEARAQQSQLGQVDFPTSGSAEAQKHFLRGVAALHSFWYEEALEEFEAATKIDPDFAMGYWGQAMTHNHPLWAQQDIAAARKVMTKIGDTAKLTSREKAFINALRTLYGEGDKDQRDLAYAKEMEKTYLAYPDDLEVASFYALSLLGLVRPGEKGFKRQMMAGAISLEIYKKNPNHPGAAHYIIHAFDDPDHAILALPAARRYGEIAPEAHHARHMPSHIFIQLGMWPEAAASNESSWAASVAWIKRKNLSPNLRDYHSLHWLNYVYLQQGRPNKAASLLTLIREAMAQPGAKTTTLLRFYPLMAAEYIIETERWDEVARLFEAPQLKGATPEKEPTAPGGIHATHAKGSGSQADQESWVQYSAEAYRSFTSGFAAAKRARYAESEKHIAHLRSLREHHSSSVKAYQARWLEILELEIAAELESARGTHSEAIDLLERATKLEEEMSPPSGPPDLVKPSHELFGEILLRANRANEATAQFARALVRQPQRARSLIGAARAAAMNGDRQAAEGYYAAFLKIQEKADERSVEAGEARSYLEQAKAR